MIYYMNELGVKITAVKLKLCRIVLFFLMELCLAIAKMLMINYKSIALENIVKDNNYYRVSTT
ncbi:MAG: hypothetical protein HN729_06385 [Candidatus Marinimicrobia bacterium]|jgi:hypothetical protein|nr:hypothetical protein [Candidatus Neomarinimicrobiota bacterium]MBT3683901.1 hypothetical protein [Candidatus Neomarinimicrobiota bacterium]MBT3896871.1 hypothetical protein [Candidatus Neomarinimicrobiota bacterium]MBT4172896.1 hypothetical protein [Candidatus Neomarinimicrobiota bacterium]MBT4538530.1 hypothetical protein [Candidatus Neomarinimicrobiota bacterium]